MLRINLGAVAVVATVGIASHALAQTNGYKQLYAFKGGNSDGAVPLSGLTDVNGLLYGTTCGGGPDDGNGTVFSFDPKTGTEKIVYLFRTNAADGTCPRAGVINVNGTLFGTTFVGGTANDGVVFSLNPQTGAEKLVYSFQGGSDGAQPLGTLLNVSGTLYGTTSLGGSSLCNGGCGTVFSLDPATGTEKVIHTFNTAQGDNDGIAPQAGLIDFGGSLYGTTEFGGAAGYGTVFSIDLKTGSEKIVHAFLGPASDGAYPHGSLIRVGATLYGTTNEGGFSSTYHPAGTVFALTPKSRAEKLVYSFQGGPSDGAAPTGSLTNVGGVLFGTTTGGGVANCTNDCGVVFSVDPATLTGQVSYFFQGHSYGGTPVANLVKVGNKLYGTTGYGGDTTCSSPGCGTIFAIKP